MSDPYNSLGNNPVPLRPAPVPPPLPDATAPLSRLPPRKPPPELSRVQKMTRWLPLWNIGAMMLHVVGMAITGQPMPFGAWLIFFTPLLLAILASHIGSPGFAWAIRGLNLLLLLPMAKRLFRYLEWDFFTSANLMILLVCTVLVPLLNVLFLRPYQEE